MKKHISVIAFNAHAFKKLCQVVKKWGNRKCAGREPQGFAKTSVENKKANKPKK